MLDSLPPGAHPCTHHTHTYTHTHSHTHTQPHPGGAEDQKARVPRAALALPEPLPLLNVKVSPLTHAPAVTSGQTAALHTHSTRISRLRVGTHEALKPHFHPADHILPSPRQRGVHPCVPSHTSSTVILEKGAESGEGGLDQCSHFTPSGTLLLPEDLQTFLITKLSKR